jgi:hypothetical protein
MLIVPVFKRVSKRGNIKINIGRMEQDAQAKSSEPAAAPGTVAIKPAVQESPSPPREEIKTPRKSASARKKRKKDVKKDDPETKTTPVPAAAVVGLPSSPPPPPDPKVLHKPK